MQRLESSRAVGQWPEAHDNSSIGSCSSLAFNTDETISASSKMAQDADEAKSESSWTALAQVKEKYYLEGEMETLEVTGPCGNGSGW